MNTLDPARFAQLWQRLGAQGDPTPIFAALLFAYTEPHRAYHSATHIADCLQQFDEAADMADRPEEVELALWFHDIVYDPRRHDNEEASVRWLDEVLQAADVAAEVCSHVGDLILATKHQAIPTGIDASLVMDVDLSILGREPAVFAEYDRRIREEYAWVPEAAYRSGRSYILAGFLQRPRLYQTDFFHVRYEEQARKNLLHTLAELRGEGP